MPVPVDDLERNAWKPCSRSHIDNMYVSSFSGPGPGRKRWLQREGVEKQDTHDPGRIPNGRHVGMLRHALHQPAVPNKVSLHRGVERNVKRDRAARQFVDRAVTIGQCVPPEVLGVPALKL